MADTCAVSSHYLITSWLILVQYLHIAWLLHGWHLCSIFTLLDYFLADTCAVSSHYLITSWLTLVQFDLYWGPHFGIAWVQNLNSFDFLLFLGTRLKVDTRQSASLPENRKCANIFMCTWRCYQYFCNRSTFIFTFELLRVQPCW